MAWTILLLARPISGAGTAYVYHGSAVGLPVQVVTLTGELAGDNFGWSVAMIGDVNDDDIDDVAIGAPTIWHFRHRACLCLLWGRNDRGAVCLQAPFSVARLT